MKKFYCPDCLTTVESEYLNQFVCPVCENEQLRDRVQMLESSLQRIQLSARKRTVEINDLLNKASFNASEIMSTVGMNFPASLEPLTDPDENNPEKDD